MQNSMKSSLFKLRQYLISVTQGTFATWVKTCSHIWMTGLISCLMEWMFNLWWISQVLEILFSLVSTGWTTLEGPKVKKRLLGASRISIVGTKFYSLCREERNWSLLIQPVKKIFTWRGELKLFSNLVILEWAMFCNIIFPSWASAFKKWSWSKKLWGMNFGTWIWT